MPLPPRSIEITACCFVLSRTAPLVVHTSPSNVELAQDLGGARALAYPTRGKAWIVRTSDDVVIDWQGRGADASTFFGEWRNFNELCAKYHNQNPPSCVPEDELPKARHTLILTLLAK